MRIIINGAEYNVPSSVGEITLGQRIQFYEVHGKQLAEMYESIQTMDEGDRELELLEFTFEKMFRTFSFFTGIPVDVLKDSEFIDDIGNIYYSSLKAIFEDEASQELRTEFTWNNEEWELAGPELKYGDKMKFAELIDAKQRIKDLVDLGNSNWHCLLPLCAVYLRKKGEPYNKEFLYDDSERLNLMKNLPLDIALNVGFFLSATTRLFLNTSQSSNQAV